MCVRKKNLDNTKEASEQADHGQYFGELSNKSIFLCELKYKLVIFVITIEQIKQKPLLL